MKTLSEERAEQYEKDQRASRFEGLLGDKAMLENELAKPVSSAAADATILAELYQLTLKLSPECLTGRGGSSIAFSVPGLIVLRDVLRPIISGAEGRAIRLANEEAERRTKATHQLALVNEELKTFNV